MDKITIELTPDQHRALQAIMCDLVIHFSDKDSGWLELGNSHTYKISKYMAKRLKALVDAAPEPAPRLLDQVLRIIAGRQYGHMVALWQAETGHEWDAGIAP